MSNPQIENDIANFIAQHTPENTYIGITDNVTRRFREHNLLADGTTEPRDRRIAWLHRDAGSEQIARNIENIFLDRFRGRIQGGGGGGQNPHHVYVYTPVAGVTRENV